MPITRLAMLVPACLMLVAVFLFLPVNGIAQEGDSADQPNTTISLDGPAPSDTAIERRIRSILEELDGYEEVTVDVRSGVVTLTGTVLNVARLDSLDQLVNRVDGVVAVDNQVAENTDVVDRLNPAIENLASRIEQIASYLPLFAVALAIFAIVTAFGFLVSSFGSLWQRVAPNDFIADIYQKIIRIAFAIGGLVLALDFLGAAALLGTILGAAGIVGLAVGFAVRDTVENFIASILLSVRQPFRPNDLVEIDGDIGHVARLTSRATILLSPDGNHIRVPNATVYKSRIVNYTRSDERRFTFQLGVDADSDLAGALETGLAALQSLSAVIDTPAPDAWVDEVGDSNVVLSFVGWVDQAQNEFNKVRGEAIRMTKGALESAGYGLPEPIYRLRLSDPVPLAQGSVTGSIQEMETPTPPPLPVVEENAEATSKDEAIERMVVEERELRGEEDLLSPAAPEE